MSHFEAWWETWELMGNMETYGKYGNWWETWEPMGNMGTDGKYGNWWETSNLGEILSFTSQRGRTSFSYNCRRDNILRSKHQPPTERWVMLIKAETGFSWFHRTFFTSCFREGRTSFQPVSTWWKTKYTCMVNWKAGCWKIRQQNTKDCKGFVDQGCPLFIIMSRFQIKSNGNFWTKSNFKENEAKL